MNCSLWTALIFEIMTSKFVRCTIVRIIQSFTFDYSVLFSHSNCFKINDLESGFFKRHRMWSVPLSLLFAFLEQKVIINQPHNTERTHTHYHTFQLKVPKQWSKIIIYERASSFAPSPCELHLCVPYQLTLSGGLKCILALISEGQIQIQIQYIHFWTHHIVKKKKSKSFL